MNFKRRRKYGVRNTEKKKDRKREERRPYQARPKRDDGEFLLLPLCKPFSRIIIVWCGAACAFCS